MMDHTNSVRRISWISILLIPLALTYILTPQVHFLLNPQSQSHALQNYAHQLYASPDQITTRGVWQMKEMLTRGYYTKNMTGIAFQSQPMQQDMKPLMTCLAQFPQDIRIISEFQSPSWKSIEMLVQDTGSDLILKTCLDISKPESTMDFRFSTPHGSLFLTVRPLETMKKTIGFIDYAGEHKDIVKGMQWYSLSYIKLD